MQQRTKPDAKYAGELFAAQAHTGGSFGEFEEVFQEPGICGSGVGIFGGGDSECGAGISENTVRESGNYQYRHFVSVVEPVSDFQWQEL